MTDVSGKNIRIVLVNSKHPGNIGSAARAMKTMGIEKLYLVSPACFPSEEAKVLASGADDLLDSAIVVNTLDEAVANCAFVVGASARIRGISLPVLSPSTCAKQMVEESAQHAVALVFGREDRGLTNTELALCHQQVHIPSIESFSSLNLAASVQVLVYELRKQILRGNARKAGHKQQEHPLATASEMEFFYGHLESLLSDISFFEHSNPEKIMAKLRRFFGRARPDKVELAILRGILTETQKKVGAHEV